ncbi:MAG TPA: 4-(cytidine 5'-diphospho)-2-C-methyl-D-erythritol kinase [Pseudolabrys sp.]|nr:4-(cytidine 5'-diphospho)-2-C-methyl-D-erythritol kinase [Pseudolabrys sp.]
MTDGGGACPEAARAKVNLSLRVLGRRDDGYHELESLVAFADIGDTLTLTPGRALSLDIDGPLAGLCGAPANNLVLKAAAALAMQVDDVTLEFGRFILTKELPVAAGLGGGSADAAAALRLLALTNGLLSDDPRLRIAAATIGADVPVCLASRARVMRGVGEQLGPVLDIGALPALLVNPGVALATKDVFAALRLALPSDVKTAEVPSSRAALVAWLAENGNDLEPPAMMLQPVIADVLAALRALPRCCLARMSGSGATCFGLFESAADADAAAKALQAKQPAWWVRATTLS